MTDDKWTKCLGSARVGASILEVYRAADEKGLEIHIEGAEITPWGEIKLHILDFDVEAAANELKTLAQTVARQSRRLGDRT